MDRRYSPIIKTLPSLLDHHADHPWPRGQRQQDRRRRRSRWLRPRQSQEDVRAAAGEGIHAQGDGRPSPERGDHQLLHGTLGSTAREIILKRSCLINFTSLCETIFALEWKSILIFVEFELN